MNQVVNGVSLQVEQGKRWRWWVNQAQAKRHRPLRAAAVAFPPVVYPGGDILFNGNSLLHASEAELRKVRGNQISMIFQEPMVSLNPLHTIEKQLAEVLMLHMGMRRDSARAEIIQCLDRVGIRNAKARLKDYPINSPAENVSA